MENRLGMQSYTQDPEPAGRQVPGAGVHGDGGEDYCFKFLGFETAMRSGIMDSFVPDLKIT